MKYSKYIHWFLYPLFALACAQQSSPTGGPQDTIPPRLISSNPRNEQLQFKGKSIELDFSELVSLSNPKEQIIITPNIGKDYEIIARNEKVILKYEQDLQDSTTYTFNFREAVTDITEKNPARNLKIALSTGTYIDSLSIEGKIFTVLDQKSVKNATIAIQPYSDTFNILKHTATYFSRTDDNGSYKLDNLKPGRYLVYAFNDQNKNLIVDSRTEAYGFKSNPLNLDTITSNIDVGLIRLDTRPLKLTSARPYNTYFNLRATKNIKSAVVTTTDSTDIYYSFGQDRANIQIYNSFPDRDSVLINISLRDSLQNQFDTTLYAKFAAQTATPEPLTYQVTSSTLLLTKGTFESKITFSKPLKEINFDSIYFKIDSTHTLTFKPANIDYQETEKILTIKSPIDKQIYDTGEANQDPEAAIKGEAPESRKKFINLFYLGYGAFISIEQDSSKAAKQRVTPLRFEDLGLIMAEVNIPPDIPFLIQLVDTKYNIIGNRQNQTDVTFEDLQPNDYYLRIIIDKNNNGQWDPGNYLRKEAPEEIIYYENEKSIREIKLKANFELGPLLITY